MDEPKKRGRKPKPKPDEPKVLKKRGRKPKPKTENEEVVPKKKRGRKKKCEMNLDAYKKISGFNENGESIDTTGNQIQFGDYSNENCDGEDIQFGILNIKKMNVVKPEVGQLHISLHQQTRTNKCKVCKIDLSEIDDTEYKDDETHEESSDKKDLYDFFTDISKNTNKLKPKSKNLYSETFKDNKDNKTSTEMIKILHCYKNNEKELPNTTDVWCWWCCHPFDGIPRFMPTKYDSIRKRYKVMGNFCSWQCTKAFMYFDNNYSITNNMNLLTKLIKDIHGKTISLSCAPPKSILKNFGGKMSIEEFRSIDKNTYFEINKTKMMIDENYFINKRIK